MKKAISLIVAFVLCLSLCACGQDTPGTSATQNPGGSENTTPSTTQTTPTTPTQTEPKPLADFDILGEWIIADDGLAVITFNEDGTCVKEGEQAVKYKVEADITVLTIYYSTPQSYNIEKVDEHYRITGEHFLFREAEQNAIQEIAVKQEKYEQAFALLEPYYVYAERPWQAIATLGNENIIAAYTLFQELGDYRDAIDHLKRFVVAENVLLKDPQYFYGYNQNRQSTWRGTDKRQGKCFYYDDNGYLIKAETTPFENGYYDSKTTYTYDAKGYLIKDVRTYGDGTTSQFVYEYDDYGALVCMQRIENDVAEVVDAYENKYNEQGQLIERKRIDGSVLYEIWEYTYDDKGNMIEEVVTVDYYGERVLDEKCLYTYKDGKLVECTTIQYSRKDGSEQNRDVKEYIYGTFYWYNAPEA